VLGGGFSAWVDRSVGNGQEIDVLMVGVVWVRIVFQAELLTFLDSIFGERGWDCGVSGSYQTEHVIRLRYQRSSGSCGKLRTLDCRILSPISVLAPRLVDGCEGRPPIRLFIGSICVPVRVVTFFFFRCGRTSPNNQNRCRHHLG